MEQEERKIQINQYFWKILLSLHVLVVSFQIKIIQRFFSILSSFPFILFWIFYIVFFLRYSFFVRIHSKYGVIKRTQHATSGCWPNRRIKIASMLHPNMYKRSVNANHTIFLFSFVLRLVLLWTCSLFLCDSFFIE